MFGGKNIEIGKLISLTICQYSCPSIIRQLRDRESVGLPKMSDYQKCHIIKDVLFLMRLNTMKLKKKGRNSKGTCNLLIPGYKMTVHVSF